MYVCAVMEFDYGLNCRHFTAMQLQDQFFSDFLQRLIEIYSEFDQSEESSSCFV